MWKLSTILEGSNLKGSRNSNDEPTTEVVVVVIVVVVLVVVGLAEHDNWPSEKDMREHLNWHDQLH